MRSREYLASVFKYGFYLGLSRKQSQRSAGTHFFVCFLIVAQIKPLLENTSVVFHLYCYICSCFNVLICLCMYFVHISLLNLFYCILEWQNHEPVPYPVTSFLWNTNWTWRMKWNHSYSSLKILWSYLIHETLHLKWIS